MIGQEVIPSVEGGERHLRGERKAAPAPDQSLLQDKPCSNVGNVGGQTSARSYST
jgi:hypothetical protein